MVPVSLSPFLVFAVGGRENDLVLYDLETQEPIFRGRNVPNDFLQLRVPIWVSDMQVGVAVSSQLVPPRPQRRLRAGGGDRLPPRPTLRHASEAPACAVGGDGGPALHLLLSRSRRIGAVRRRQRGENQPRGSAHHAAERRVQGEHRQCAGTGRPPVARCAGLGGAGQGDARVRCEQQTPAPSSLPETETELCTGVERGRGERIHE